MNDTNNTMMMKWVLAARPFCKNPFYVAYVMRSMNCNLNFNNLFNMPLEYQLGECLHFLMLVMKLLGGIENDSIKL